MLADSRVSTVEVQKDVIFQTRLNLSSGEGGMYKDGITLRVMALAHAMSDIQ